MVTFGDDPAACALELCKVRAALDSVQIDQQAASQLVRSGFVDDIGGGGTLEEVRRMKGERQGDGTYSGTVPKVLLQGGFTAKALIQSGDCSEEEAHAMGGKFLGIKYDPQVDEIQVGIKTTIRAKHQSQQRGKATSLIDWDDDFVEEVLAGEKTRVNKMQTFELIFPRNFLEVNYSSLKFDEKMNNFPQKSEIFQLNMIFLG